MLSMTIRWYNEFIELSNLDEDDTEHISGLMFLAFDRQCSIKKLLDKAGFEYTVTQVTQ